MNRDRLFDEMGGIRDAYILSAADLLGYEKEDKLMHLPQAAKARKMTRAILIAAAITALLAVTVFAMFFAFSYRVPEGDETFRFHWEESPSGYAEWRNVKLALTFPDTPESRKIQFHPTSLPFSLPSAMLGCDPNEGLTEETWFSRFSGETLCWEGEPNYLAEYGAYGQPLLIQSYAMSQFNDGGAMLLLGQTPGEIIEERWDEQNADVLRFTATISFEGDEQLNLPARTLTYNYVILSNAQSGWVLVITGELDMDTLVAVAKGLEIRESGETVVYEDFVNHYALFDCSVG